jgi:hypothetical protein
MTPRATPTKTDLRRGRVRTGSASDVSAEEAALLLGGAPAAQRAAKAPARRHDDDRHLISPPTDGQSHPL